MYEKKKKKKKKHEAEAPRKAPQQVELLHVHFTSVVADRSETRSSLKSQHL